MGAVVLCLDGAFSASVAKYDSTVTCIFTEAPKYEPKAWTEGRDRFPLGATLNVIDGGRRHLLVPGFFASADASVSYDARRVLFAGKRTPADRWQIFELDLHDGPPRRITHCEADCVRPLYLPDGQIVYTHGDNLEINGKRLTFAPGLYLTDDVLRDGRILFEAARGSQSREIFTVYPDGTGVEALRCDHGPDRGAARQIASGDYIFSSGNRLARITSALAQQTEVAQPEGEPIGPIAEAAPGVWLLSMRRRTGDYGLYRWSAATKETMAVEIPGAASAVEPVVIAPRAVPREFPSALVPTRTAGNLLCLNARASRSATKANAQAVKVYTPAGLLGQTELEKDGSFYIQVPADRPIRMELVDAAGRVVQAERHWFWVRPSEQRICVGCHLGPERAPENKVPDILLKTIVPVKMLEVQQP
jgi:hypothetical protein